ncbi:MAG TPA: hypothetical protein PLN63_00690 [Paludibacteraceae bacterium]|nr:hypothetical protein [Paludibacteraceae bacterium]HOU67251.1 hypothetical protein [Paludibacteraceae bacterium]HPH62130.1 hypothetical protein [Paludibacteraceae bacterium]HQF49320.1 hypothetical protein [Paludibacteraceae bacterium]HQJ89004.1 hypothetical protein [Paludibacteraceae bacterium]
MKTNELRIGNQILVNGRMHEVSASDIFTLAQNESLGVEIASCTPVKITEDMLFRLGFKFEYEKVQDRVYVNEDINLYWNKQAGYSLLYLDKQIGKPFHYLHQLQNLCFDLTAKPLLLKD